MRKEMSKDFQAIIQRCLNPTPQQAFEDFIARFKRELLPIVFEWSERGNKVFTFISWQEPEDFEGCYGSNPGLYIASEREGYFIYLPKTTLYFISFIKAMKKYYIEQGREVLIHGIPTKIYLEYDGESKIQFKFISDVENEQEMTSAKLVANELIGMFSGDENVKFYEGDDKGYVYSPGDKFPLNYFIGIVSEYDI